MTPPRITVLTPVYNEADNLAAYEGAVREVLLSRSDIAVDVLLIDDGSTDQSWRAISGLCGRDPRFRAIRLSRNFGSHVALSAGFAEAGGDAVATLACDLQDPPETILAFVERWKAGARIVWGHRANRRDTRWRVWASRLFFLLIKRYAMPRGSRFTTGSFLLADRRVVECFNQFREHNRVTFALMAWTGFDQDVVNYERRERRAGRSGWTFGRMLRAMYDTFIGFSDLPVRMMTLLGIGISLANIPLAIYLIVGWMAGDRVQGWTSIMLALTFFFGIQFLLTGLMGEYLHRIHAEAMRRPLYFISDRAGGSDAALAK